MDRVNGLEGVRVEIVMMRTPDGHGRLELTKFRNPELVEIEPAVAVEDGHSPGGRRARRVRPLERRQRGGT